MVFFIASLSSAWFGRLQQSLRARPASGSGKSIQTAGEARLRPFFGPEACHFWRLTPERPRGHALLNPSIGVAQSRKGGLMSLKDKYADLLKLGEELHLSGSKVSEEAGKLKVWGTAEYQLQKDKFWDKVKTYSSWEQDLVADIKVDKTDVYGYYVVKPGDSLSKIAKDVYDNGGLYNKIYEANKATIGDNPNMIKPGQKLTIPNR
jgi:nucleoid-associated protein YgaU